MLKITHSSFAFIKYIFVKRSSYVVMRSAYALNTGLLFLVKFGFVMLHVLVKQLLVCVISINSRPPINHMRLFLKNSNAVFVKPTLLHNLFFYCPSALWLTVWKKKITPISTLNKFKYSDATPIPIKALIT